METNDEKSNREIIANSLVFIVHNNIAEAIRAHGLAMATIPSRACSRTCISMYICSVLNDKFVCMVNARTYIYRAYSDSDQHFATDCPFINGSINTSCTLPTQFSPSISAYERHTHTHKHQRYAHDNIKCLN